MNYYEEYVASVYDASGERIYDCGGVVTLINTKAPSGKFRVIADNFGKWAAKHDDILVGDFDTLEAARREAKLWHARPAHEHWSVTVFDDKGAIVQ